MKNALQPQQLPRAMEGLKYLCKLTNVFPTPDQQLWLGQKVAVMDRLAGIAKAVTKTAFPKLFVIKDPSDPRLIRKSGSDLWVERSYSDGLLAFQRWSPQSEFKEKLRKWKKDTEEGYNHDQLSRMGVEARWIGTLFPGSFEPMGEALVYFVGGRERRCLMSAKYHWADFSR